MADYSLEELLNRTGNIYESVMIIAKRARQINDRQKQLIEREMEKIPVIEAKENDELDEVEIDREALARNRVKYPKPTRVAIEEMQRNEIEYKYNEETEVSEVKPA